METSLMVIGKTTSKYIISGIDEYVARVKHYLPFELQVIPDIKGTRGMTPERQKEEEGKLILSRLTKGDALILLDERGKELTSVEFSEYMSKKMSSGLKRTVFAVGGPYGFSKDVYARADGMLSLSRMTFPHELVRLFFVEQLYRAMTILRGEPYHHI